MFSCQELLSAPGPAAADAVMGVVWFSEEAPDDFERFNRAFLALFKVCRDSRDSPPGLLKPPEYLLGGRRSTISYRFAPTFFFSLLKIVIYVRYFKVLKVFSAIEFMWWQ